MCGARSHGQPSWPPGPPALGPIRRRTPYNASLNHRYQLCRYYSDGTSFVAVTRYVVDMCGHTASWPPGSDNASCVTLLAHSNGRASRDAADPGWSRSSVPTTTSCDGTGQL